MNALSMILRILAILGAIAAAALYFVIGDRLADTEADLQQTESRLQTREGELRTVTEEKEELEGNVAELEEQLDTAENEVSSLRNELSQVRRELEQAQQVISRREQEAEEIQQEAARIRRELLEEQRRIAELEQEMDEEDAAAMRQHIRDLEQELRETERRMREIAEDEPVVTDGREPEPRRPVLRSEVVEVSEDRDLILISAGEEDGARAGSRLLIRRAGRYVGEAQITEVQEDASVAQVLPGAGRVRTGDIVVSLQR